MKARTLVELLLLGGVFVACATPCQRIEQQSSTPAAAPTPSFPDIRVVEPENVEPGFAEAAAATKSRGDAAFGAEGFIFRGATAGLIIGKLEEATFFEKSVVYLQGAANDIVVQGQYAFVACGPAGVAVVDVGDPLRPRVVRIVDTPGGAVRLSLAREKLIVADGSQGVVLLDVSAPTNPKPSAHWIGEGYIRHAVAVENYIFAAEDDRGVAVLSLAQGELALVTRIETEGYARALAVQDNRLYVADGPEGVAVIDVEKPTDSRIIGRLKTPDLARDVVVQQKRIYVASGDGGLVEVDVRDPSNMTQRRILKPEMPVNRVNYAGGELLVGNDAGGLIVVDIKVPESPKQVYPEPRLADPAPETLKSVSN